MVRLRLCVCRYTVMFCHGWQNKASRATDGSLNAGHVTPRKSNSDTLRLFLFSYNGTKINSGFAQDATHKPATHHLDGRRISPTSHHLANQLFNTHQKAAVTTIPCYSRSFFLFCRHNNLPQRPAAKSSLLFSS